MPGSGTVRASSSITASPLFMSHEPSPQRTSPSMRARWLSLGGTVSVWPPMSSRWGRPRWVRATRFSPTRVTSSQGAAASRSSRWSVMAISL